MHFSARDVWHASFLWWEYGTAAYIGDFLGQSLMLIAGGGMLYAGGADADFGFVTRCLPVDFVAILRRAAVWCGHCGASVRFFLAHLRFFFLNRSLT